MKFRTLTLLLIMSVLFVTAGGPTPNVAASPSAVAPDLGTAASFVGLAASTFTNTGSGVYYGNVGVFPGSAVEGFPPGTVENGEIYRGGAVPEQAQIDALAAYNDLAGRPCNTNLTSQDLGGKTLQPGVYCFNTSAQLTGDLVLDAMGDPHAIWVFQTGSTLTTASGSTVRLINGAQIFNVFWKVGTSATLGTTTRFKGTIIADQSITLETGASLSGRALALNGGVTMDTEGSPPMSNPQLGIVKQVYPVSAIPDQVITYTITFANYGSELVTGIMISDTIPISVTNTSVISSGVAITQVQDTRYAWDIAPLEVGQGGIITITGQLISTLPGGTFTNTATITSTELERDFENDTSSASVTVAPMTDLRIVKDVSSIHATPGQPITYTLTFSNAGNERVTGVVITDILPISVTNTSVISSGVAITQANGSRYVWDIAPLNIGQGGVITITGVLSDGLQGGDVFTNTASITTTSATESDTSNNASSASVIVAAEETYVLTIHIVGDGSVTSTPPGTVMLPYHLYPAGTVVTLTATPDMGWHFTGWSGDLSGEVNPDQLTMDADKVVTATFMTKIYLPLVQRNSTP